VREGWWERRKIRVSFGEGDDDVTKS